MNTVKQNKNTKLLGVSGGADSMFLLEKYQNEKIIVAHVNYQKRSTSSLEEELVRDFCLKKNISFYIKRVQKEQYQKSNFQVQAREIRYRFFQEVYQKNNCSELVLGHHKDDLIETYLWQKKSKRKPLIWGMEKVSWHHKMKITRPFLFKYYKKQILQKLTLQYHDDESNFEDKYYRNRLRKRLEKHPFLKKVLFLTIVVKNMLTLERRKSIAKEYNLWKAHDFRYNFVVKSKYFNYLMTKFLQEKILDETGAYIKLSKKKLDIIYSFLKAKEQKNKLLTLRKDVKLKKAHNNLKLIYLTNRKVLT